MIKKKPPREKIIVVSGTFDPLELGDIEFLRWSKNQGDWLIVGVHSDVYLANNNGGFVQNYHTRSSILKELKFVDEVFAFNDLDGSSCQLLKLVQLTYTGANIIFANSNGREFSQMPEAKVKGITFLNMR